jgi:hypothetical protein
MPTILRKNGFSFFFYSNEHRPIHVHVEKGDGDAKFNLEPLVELVESHGLKTRDLSDAEEIINEHLQQIIEAWKAYHS